MGLTWWSWRKWPDPLIDCGRELYVPWQITRGKVLYRDLASLFGPLSSYVNALWFRLFGVSLLTLAAGNLFIFATMTAGIHWFVRGSTNVVTATAASLSILLLFGFSQYVGVGNYNFVTPYSHEATHGLALSIATLACVLRAIAMRRRVLWLLAGVCFGLVLLTKPEVAIAAATGVAAAVIGAGLLVGSDRRSLATSALLFVTAAVVPALFFFLYFASHMPQADALRATAGAWMAPLNAAIAANPFYIRGMGFDRPVANLGATAVAFAGFAGFIAVGAWIAVRTTPSRRRFALATAIFLVVAMLALRGGTWPRALPLIAATSVIVTGSMFVRSRGARNEAVKRLSLAAWSMFGLVLLAKMGINARIAHYGFYLALPATVTAIVLVCWLVPHVLAIRYSQAAGEAFRRIALWTLALAVAPYLGLSHAWYRTKVISIGSDGDRFLASKAPALWQGQAVHDAADYLARSAPPDAQVAVLPEGVMLNYLARRDSPLRVINLMPPEMLAFGEAAVLQSLARRPPQLVLLVHKDMREYGYPQFGTDPRYGLTTVTWIRDRYRTVRIVGAHPMSPSGSGIEILERVIE